MAEEPLGCAQPTGSAIGEQAAEEAAETKPIYKEKTMSAPLVGAKAPDFEAPAYHKGKFVDVKLSDYQGKWILLCFYPGDFTFV